MSNNSQHSIERIGKAIYPLRVFGFILFGISIILSQSKMGYSLDTPSIVGLIVCVVYPHLAYLRYLRNEERETEITHMQVDMALIGALMALICFTPAVALPYLIANSSANYALRGMKQVVKGLSLAFVSAMLVGLFLDQHAVFEATPLELLGPFVYLTIVTHYMGFLAYARGISLLRRKKEAEEMAHVDFLTGLINRRSLFQKVRQNDTNPEVADLDTTLIMVDLDYFKQVNDVHGHDHGDAVLVQVSELIKNGLRQTDLVARWGGEEFLVLLPKTNLKQGITVAEEIREKVANGLFKHDGVEHKVTLTLGVASYTCDSNFQETLQLADKALYEGKELGRNRVVSADGSYPLKKPCTKAKSDKASTI